MNKNYYHYKECDLPNVYLVNGFTYKNNGIKIEGWRSDLHNAIGEFLVSYRKLLNGKELKFIRRQLSDGEHISKECIGSYIGKSRKTIAEWERGKTKTDSSSDRLIRLLYLEHIERNHNEIWEELELISEIKDVIPKYPNMVFEKTEDGWMEINTKFKASDKVKNTI